MGRKVYGESRVDKCPFCGTRAVAENSQGVPVCNRHKGEKMRNLKCMCGDWLELKKGKYGVFGHCIHCGNVSFSRVLEMNPQKKEIKKEMTIRSDELDFI